MAKIEFEVQEDVAKYIDTSVKGLALLMYPQIKNRTLTCSKAAEMLGVSEEDLFIWYMDFGIVNFDVMLD